MHPNPKRPKHKIVTISLAWKVGSPFHPPPGVLLLKAENSQAKITWFWMAAPGFRTALKGN
jgi:hypothetical protein